jgi:predicted Zn-dependent protease
VDKELTAYVSAVGQRLAKVSDRPKLPYEFVVLNNGVPNAWALPGGKIAVNRGLLQELHNEAELAAVLGHEIVHSAARHGAKSMERGMILNAGVVGLGVALGDEKNTDLIMGAAGLGASLISQKYGRDAELESDHYGMKYMAKAGYNPQAAVTLQATFVRLSKGRQSNWLEGLFASHPPSQERVKANRKYAKKLGNKGMLGEQEYQAKIAHLKKAQPAYAAYEKGQKALADKKPDAALKLAHQALELEPREGMFYSLQGEAWLAKGDTKDNRQKAEASFSRALEHNSGYFLPHLQRGLTRLKMGKDKDAKVDLEASVKLLPTAPAYVGLGDLAAKAGDEQKAVDYYRQASASQSKVGKQAATKLARLDLPKHPEKYLAVKAALSQRGTVSLEIDNHAALAVHNIQLIVRLVAASGQTVGERSLYLRETIPSGRSLRVDSGLSAPTAKIAVQVQITQAQLAE